MVEYCEQDVGFRASPRPPRGSRGRITKKKKSHKLLKTTLRSKLVVSFVALFSFDRLVEPSAERDTRADASLDPVAFNRDLLD